MNPGRFGTQVVGVAFVVVLALVGWLTVAIYDKDFSDAEIVVLHTDRVGSQLGREADVKVRGVPFGTVRSVRTDGSGARVELAMNPDTIGQLPRNVSARLLPKSVFGERFVELEIPPVAAAARLAGGDEIPQDRTRRAIELETVLDKLLPLLRAVQPQKLASTLGAVSTALDGQGRPIGRSVDALNVLLHKVNPLLPRITTDIGRVGDVSDLYNGVAPDVLAALSDLGTTSRTLVDQRDQLAALLRAGTTASESLTGFLRRNSGNLIGVAADSRRTLTLLARYSPEFGCLFDAVDRLRPLMDAALGTGTSEHGLHVTLTIRPPRQRYLPGRDTPRDAPGIGPRCYAPGAVGGIDPSTAPQPNAFAAAPPSLTADGLGVPNSPYERRLVGDLVSATTGTPRAQVPDWSSVLVGPLLRGTEVTLR